MAVVLKRVKLDTALVKSEPNLETHGAAFGHSWLFLLLPQCYLLPLCHCQTCIPEEIRASYNIHLWYVLFSHNEYRFFRFLYSELFPCFSFGFVF